jgi:hypothetical protein
MILMFAAIMALCALLAWVNRSERGMCLFFVACVLFNGAAAAVSWERDPSYRFTWAPEWYMQAIRGDTR